MSVTIWLNKSAFEDVMARFADYSKRDENDPERKRRRFSTMWEHIFALIWETDWKRCHHNKDTDMWEIAFLVPI